MRLVRRAERRVTTTPNATMTTLASPTLGAASRSVWLVEMDPAAEGPDHAFEDEVVWSVMTGQAILSCDGQNTTVEAGDTVVLPGGSNRRFVAGATGFSAVVTTSGPGTVTRADGTDVGTPDWVT